MFKVFLCIYVRLNIYVSGCVYDRIKNFEKFSANNSMASCMSRTVPSAYLETSLSSSSSALSPASLSDGLLKRERMIAPSLTSASTSM
jgi:hypothetical protein